MWGYVSRKAVPTSNSHSSSVRARAVSDTAWMKFFIVSVATTRRLSPFVYASRNPVPRTTTSIPAATSVLSRPANGDSGIGVTPVRGSA
jgi:hypothetical protein